MEPSRSNKNSDLDSDQRIDVACDKFEAEWMQGLRPEILRYLQVAGGDQKSSLFFELLLVELECRKSFGECPTRAEYLNRFEQFSTEIEAANFGPSISEFATVSNSIRDTVRIKPRQTPTRISHFELCEKLGSGSMGDVWKAWDTELHRFVALKTPRIERLSNSETHRFLREGRAAAQLRHTNIAAVYEVGHEGHTPFIASELIDGKNLKQYFNRQIRFEALANICADVADALAHAHDRNVVHRDLKPANIVVDREGVPHVIDFGLAKWSSDSRDITIQGELLGTPAYMSPEQARGDNDGLTFSTDIYSLGVVLYESITGRCPFLGDWTTVICQIANAAIPSPRTLNKRVPRDLETICLKALEKSPHQRYAPASEMASDLRRFSRGEPILARRPTMLNRSWRFVKRRPSVVISLALSLVIGLSAIVIGSLSQENLRLQGYRRVLITTEPSGAKLAVVPINKSSNEPYSDPAKVIRPDGTTPLEVQLKPGDYFVEAISLADGTAPDFGEYRISVGDATTRQRSESQSSRQDELIRLPLLFIPNTRGLDGNMVEIPIPDDLRKANPLLPETILVDRAETVVSQEDALGSQTAKWRLSETGERYIPFDNAVIWAEANGKRLPSAAEYDAIVASLAADKASSPRISDIASGAPEWTTTQPNLPVNESSGSPTSLNRSLILKGYGDIVPSAGVVRGPDGEWIASRATTAPAIGFRGVRSGRPRFWRDEDR